MSWPTISAEEALRRLAQGARGLDVRSEGEFADGALPGFVNAPILCDEHRHQVGLTYKQRGQAEAIRLGHLLVDPIKPDLILRWSAALGDLPEAQRMLICWRGGVRSQIAADWLLSEAGFGGVRVTGGYKAIRKALLAALAEAREVVLLSGFTGAGKTELLWRLPPSRTIDLEALAEHRGSAFGGHYLRLQPSQQTFENRLGFELWRKPGPLVLEHESFLIGACAIPQPLREVLAQAPVVVLRAPLHERVRRVYQEYVEAPAQAQDPSAVIESLEQGLGKIQRRLGGLRFATIRDSMRAAFAQGIQLESHVSWIESLLRDYYDPLYVNSLRYEGRKLEFEGDATGVQDYLSARLSGRRT